MLTNYPPQRLEVKETATNLALKEALLATIDKVRTRGIELYLTGGTAAAIYGGESRPLSLDLDFFVQDSDRMALEILFGGKFTVHAGKKLFKSNKLVGTSDNGVDLDFIVAQNIVPDESFPDQKISLCLSPEIIAGCQSKEFLGVEVKVLPPEVILIAKLFAGRGEDVGKYDLVDSLAILENCNIDMGFVSKLIELLAGNNQVVKSLLIARLNAALLRLSSPEKMAVSQTIKSIMELINTHASNQID